MIKKDDPMQAVMEVVDEVTDPKLMSKRQYVEFLGELINDLEVRAEAVEQELKGEAGE